MSINYGPSIPATPCFVWDGTNKKSWAGSGNTHYDLITGTVGTFSGAGSLTLSSGHVLFAPNPVASTNTAVIQFSPTALNLPTGSQGSWSWWYYYTSSQSIDAPNFGHETSNQWDGVNGFVFGTGWGNDGLRMGVGGTAVYVPGSGGPAYVYNQWQQITVTYIRNGAWLEYVNGSLAFSTTAPNNDIGSNANNLIIGGTNSRGGNWRGSMDIVQMWNRALSATEVLQNFNALRGRYGL
jgi:hypothetical protein